MEIKVKFEPTMLKGLQEDLDGELVKKLAQYMESQISVSTASMMGVATDCKAPEDMTFTYEDLLSAKRMLDEAYTPWRETSCVEYNWLSDYKANILLQSFVPRILLSYEGV